MGGVNPATKQVEKFENGHSDEETVDELLEKYEEVKEKTNASLSPHEVKELLPSRAEMKSGKLHVDSETKKDDYATLTPMRKDILRAIDKGLSGIEIEKRGISSSSYASRTRREFGFILENPALRSAFLDKGRVRDNWRLVDPETGTELTFETRAAAYRNFERVCNTFGVPEVYHRGEEITPENEFEIKTEDDFRPDDSMESFEEGIENPLDDEDWQSIIAALHRDDQDTLASFLMDRFL